MFLWKNMSLSPSRCFLQNVLFLKIVYIHTVDPQLWDTHSYGTPIVMGLFFFTDNSTTFYRFSIFFNKLSNFHSIVNNSTKKIHKNVFHYFLSKTEIFKLCYTCELLTDTVTLK